MRRRTAKVSPPSWAVEQAGLGEMIGLPGGEFLIDAEHAGSHPEDGEGPVRTVAVGAFRIEATPVTNVSFVQMLLRRTASRAGAFSRSKLVELSRR